MLKYVYNEDITFIKYWMSHFGTMLRSLIRLLLQPYFVVCNLCHIRLGVDLGIFVI